jgi:hypothetical protein
MHGKAVLVLLPGTMAAMHGQIFFNFSSEIAQPNGPIAGARFI